MSFTNTPAATVEGRNGRSSVFAHRKAPRSSVLLVVTSPPHVGGHLAEPVAEGGRHELGLLERGQVAAYLPFDDAPDPRPDTPATDHPPISGRADQDGGVFQDLDRAPSLFGHGRQLRSLTHDLRCARSERERTRENPQ